jgi:hypothetical protein
MMAALQPLRPFDREPWLESLRLEASAQWQVGVLHLAFALADPEGTVLIPDPSPAPQRRDGLWQSTCLEAFFAVGGEPQYWELNLAPSGHWNLYRLEAYRQGLQPEAAISTLPHQLQRSPNGLELQLDLPLQPLIQPTAELELSLTAVLDQRGHGCSYWAWDHVAAEPDFHQRSSFQPIPKRK